MAPKRSKDSVRIPRKFFSRIITAARFIAEGKPSKKKIKKLCCYVNHQLNKCSNELNNLTTALMVFFLLMKILKSGFEEVFLDI
jgi:hypothetical protein